MPTISRGVASSLGFGFSLGSSMPITSWFAYAKGAGTYDNTGGRAIVLDSSNNIYMCGYAAGTYVGITVVKHSPSLVQQWAVTIKGDNMNNTCKDIVLDSSNNIYIIVNVTHPSTGAKTGRIYKLSSADGSIIWQKELYSDISLAGIAITTANTIYVAGTTTETGVNRFLAVKLDSTGTIIWKKSVGVVSGQQVICNNLAMDSSENLYLVGYRSFTNYMEGVIVKLTSAGALTSSINYGNSGQLTNDNLQGVTTNGTYYYTVGYSSPSTSDTGNYITLCKFNCSDNTIVWQRSLDQASSSEKGYNVRLDSSSNVYIIGYGASGNSCFVAKYDSSGTIQWQRGFGTGYLDTLESIYIDTIGNFYVCMSSSFVGGSGSAFLFAKLPVNGSKTGTYLVGVAGTSVSYTASTLTASTPTLGTFANSDAILTSTVSIRDAATAVYASDLTTRSVLI